MLSCAWLGSHIAGCRDIAALLIIDLQHCNHTPCAQMGPCPSLALSGAQAFANLTKLSDATYGLLPIDPSQGPWFKPTRADITLNSWAAWLAKQAAPPPSAGALLSSPWSGVVTQAGSWKAAAGRQLVTDAQEARAAQPPGQYSDLETLSWARLALGGNWGPEGASSQIAGDLAMSRLTGAVGNLSTGAQARVALTLLEQGQGAKSPVVQQVVRTLTSAVRVGGRTAYVASGLGSRSAAGEGTCPGCCGLRLRVHNRIRVK